MTLPKHLTLIVHLLLECFPFLVNINITDVNIIVHILHECVLLFLLCMYLCYVMGFASASVDYAEQRQECRTAWPVKASHTAPRCRLSVLVLTSITTTWLTRDDVQCTHGTLCDIWSHGQGSH